MPQKSWKAYRPYKLNLEVLPHYIPKKGSAQPYQRCLAQKPVPARGHQVSINLLQLNWNNRQTASLILVSSRELSGFLSGKVREGAGGCFPPEESLVGSWSLPAGASLIKCSPATLLYTGYSEPCLLYQCTFCDVWKRACFDKNWALISWWNICFPFVIDSFNRDRTLVLQMG